MTSQELAQDWLTLIEAEFREMPGLQLTECQMRRLWGLDDVTCTVIIDTLVEAGVLCETPKHQFTLSALAASDETRDRSTDRSLAPMK